MLNKSSVSVGVNLAEFITDAGIQLIPKQSTLIQELVRSLSSANNNSLIETSNKDFIGTRLLTESNGTESVVKGTKIYNASSHDTLMDNYIVDLSIITNNHISFARNVVNKEVTKLSEQFQSDIESFNFKEAEDFFKVNYFKLHPVFKSYIIENEINSYKGSTKDFFFDSVDFSSIQNTDFNLLDYLLVGDEEQDQHITNWFSSCDKVKLTNYVVGNTEEYTLSVAGLLDYSLVNYLFYRNLGNKTDLNLGYSINQLKSKALANRDYFAKKLSIALFLYSKDIKYGTILLSDSQTAFSYLNKEPLNIYIYEETFEKLAKDNVPIEAIFGYLASENSVKITAQELTANVDKYLTKWSAVKNIYLVSMANSKIDIYKQILRQNFDNSVTELTDAEKEFNADNSIYKQETLDLAHKYIDKLELSDFDNCAKIFLHLVANIRFRFSSAGILLTNMQEILELDDDVTVHEAALFSGIYYITDFLCEQVSETRV